MYFYASRLASWHQDLCPIIIHNSFEFSTLLDPRSAIPVTLFPLVAIGCTYNHVLTPKLAAFGLKGYGCIDYMTYLLPSSGSKQSYICTLITV